MKTYDEFELTESDIKRLKINNAKQKIRAFIKKNGIEPNDINSFYTVTNDELERHRISLYSDYLAKGKIPENAGEGPSMKPVYDEWIVATYNVTTTNEPTKIWGKNIDMVGAMMIDETGVTPVSGYTFDSLGTHIVKIMVKESNGIPDNAFEYCTQLRKIIIPSCVHGFGKNCFMYCNGLEEIYFFPINAPSFSNVYWGTYQQYTFLSLQKNGKFYYPKGSDYSSFSEKTGYYTLGDSGWEGIEMDV